MQCNSEKDNRKSEETGHNLSGAEQCPRARCAEPGAVLTAIADVIGVSLERPAPWTVTWAGGWTIDDVILWRRGSGLYGMATGDGHRRHEVLVFREANGACWIVESRSADGKCALTEIADAIPLLEEQRSA